MWGSIFKNNFISLICKTYALDYIFIASIFVCLFLFKTAQASQVISFQKNVPPLIEKGIQNFFLHTPSPFTDYSKNKIQLEFASLDLNEDGIQEIVLKEQNCLNPCSYLILGQTFSNDFFAYSILGEIKAHNLSLANTYTQGIRDIMALGNTYNDFASILYKWDSKASQYTKVEERP